MAKATAEVTVYHSKSVKAVYRYYLLQSTKPSKPTTFPPATTWVLTEPSYTEGSTNNLYFVDCTEFTNGSFSYSDVSISTSYQAAKLAYNKASSATTTANATASSLAAWCHANDKTLINGAKIYTGSITADKIAAGTITADKLKVDSLQAIAANIGGFSIADHAFYSGTTYLQSSEPGVYLGTDGIATADEEGAALIEGSRTLYSLHDKENYTRVNASGIFLASYGEGASWTPQNIEFHKDNNKRLEITYDGIYDLRRDKIDKLIGTNEDDLGLTILGQDTKLFGNLYMGAKGDIGTNGYPTGSHVLANNKYMYCVNTSGANARVIGLTSADNIIIGSNAGENNNIYAYVNTGSSFNVAERSTYIFGTYVEDGNRYFKCVPINERTTTGGTAVRIGSDNNLYKYTSSSMRYKEEITQKLDDSLNPERLYDLGVYQYKYRDGHIDKKDQRYGMTHIGFLAEDVKHKYPIAANYNDDGQVEDWSERYLIPAMLKLIQNQNKEIQNIKATLKGEAHENH